MKKLLLTLVLVLAAQLTFAQDAFKKDVVKYLALSGQRTTFEMLMKDLEANIPADKLADFKKEMTVAIDDLMNRMADLYMKEFTHDDIKAAIAFCESPVGKKITAKSEVLYTQGKEIGQEWGASLQPLLMKYMQ
jgi:uncharacterized protein